MILPLMLALAGGPQCLDGYYDLGEKSAALGFACATDEEGKNIGANIRFCNREELLKEGTCNGRDDIPCSWKEAQQAWWCHEENFDAAVIPGADGGITYHFRSSFNEGELPGTKVPVSSL